MKVYQILTKPYQDFSFYNRNKILTLTSDLKFPHISSNLYYDGNSHTWIQMSNLTVNHLTNTDYVTILNGKSGIGSYSNIPHKITCPYWFVNKKHYIEHMKEQIEAILETSMTLYDKDFNIFVFKKYLNLKKDNKNLLAVGACAYPNIKGIRCHSEFTNHCQKLLNLKAFW